MNDKQNARIVYADIINLPHFQSTKRPHMSLYDRAAQFAPFAALTGFDDMVTEELRHCHAVAADIFADLRVKLRSHLYGNAFLCDVRHF